MNKRPIEIKLPPNEGPIKIKRWKIRKGMVISARQLIFYYTLPQNSQQETADALLKFKSSQPGTVCDIIAKENTLISPGDVLLSLEECSHPTVMKEMCAECGADLRQDDLNNIKASIPMVHSIPELKVSEEQAQLLGKADETRLVNDRKLVLLVDLDQTLIHTTNDNISPNIKDVVHFQLFGPQSPWYHTRIRPGTPAFLDSVSKLFELHICTFGARNYAHYIAMFLDPGGKFFSHRILSRDECFDPNSKTANLKALFPCGDKLVCIIDDREDVWNYAPNVIHVKPYHFFQHTGDINAPPGLTKKENDVINKELEIESKEHDKDKKQIKEKHNSGETTTDKDTEDETESKKKVSDEPDNDSVSNTEKNGNDNIENKYEEVSTNTEVPKEITELEDKKNDKTEKEENGSFEKTDSMIDVEDNDDYLLYLEDILKKIHTNYYKEYDEFILQSGKETSMPDLKIIIPKVKKKVLEGCQLVFSGLVPSHVPLKRSRAYLVAASLGATVTEEVTANCTHLVAARPGTAKVNSSRRFKGINIVTPDWLWQCAERWNRVDERLFPLGRGVSTNRHPPAHCSSPQHLLPDSEDSPAPKQSQSDSEKFSDTINPLLTFSREDRQSMDKEVEDLCKDEEDDSESEQETLKSKIPTIGSFPSVIATEEASSSSESFNEDAPKGWSENSIRKAARKRKIGETTTCTESEDLEEESPNEKFRRGEPLPSDLDFGDESQEDTMDSEGNFCEDDADWTLMGAALEREFLSGD